MINDIHFVQDNYYSGFYNPLHKYTIELLFDDRKIPDKYVISENQVLYNYNKIYKKLGKRGDLDIIQKILTTNPYYCSNVCAVIMGAARVGNIDVLKWIQGNLLFEEQWNSVWYSDYGITSAVRGRNFKILNWLMDHGGKISHTTMSAACKKGYSDMLKCVDVKYSSCGSEYHAALNGHMEVIEYLESKYPSTLQNICDGAARGGHLDILKFGYAKGYSLNKYFDCKHVHIYQWLIENDHIEPDIHVSEMTMEREGIECLQLLHANNFPIISKTAFNNAIFCQNIKKIKYLYGSGCPISPDAGFIAARVNDIKILKLLIKWNYELDDEVCYEAAKHGNISILEFALVNGCKLDSRVINEAASHGHLHVIIWARARGCLWDEEACNKAAGTGNLDLLKWLRGVDRNTCGLCSDETEICPWDIYVCFNAIDCNHINILKFALENGQELEAKIYIRAITSKNRHINDYARRRWQESI